MRIHTTMTQVLSLVIAAARDRPPRADARGRRRSGRDPARRCCSSGSARGASTSRGRRAASGAQAPRPSPRARRTLAVLVAYGEIASSIYFALGIVALHAVGFTPLVLLGVGLLFLLVALSYAEATSALPETGGAATFVRRATNDLAGFMTGWVLFLDYLIVIALSALFVPHYLAGALQIERARPEPVGRRRRRRRHRLRRRDPASSAAPRSTPSRSSSPRST